MVAGGLVASRGDSGNAATSAKWLERPVEKLSLSAAHYEEEEDPELARYIWDRKAQRPRNDNARAVPSKQPPVPAHPAASQRVPPPPPQRQRALLNQVMEMGFDEPSAKRALSTTGWVGVEEA